jgi:hypothetical protein
MCDAKSEACEAINVATQEVCTALKNKQEYCDSCGVWWGSKFKDDVNIYDYKDAKSFSCTYFDVSTLKLRSLTRSSLPTDSHENKQNTKNIRKINSWGGIERIIKAINTQSQHNLSELLVIQTRIEETESHLDDCKLQAMYQVANYDEKIKQLWQQHHHYCQQLANHKLLHVEFFNANHIEVAKTIWFEFHRNRCRMRNTPDCEVVLYISFLCNGEGFTPDMFFDMAWGQYGDRQTRKKEFDSSWHIVRKALNRGEPHNLPIDYDVLTRSLIRRIIRMYYPDCCAAKVQQNTMQIYWILMGEGCIRNEEFHQVQTRVKQSTQFRLNKHTFLIRPFVQAALVCLKWAEDLWGMADQHRCVCEGSTHFPLVTDLQTVIDDKLSLVRKRIYLLRCGKYPNLQSLIDACLHS